MQNGFIFYRSFADAFRRIENASERCKCYDALIAYALDGVEPKESGVFASLFVLIKPQIDANARRREIGKLGGRPKNQSETKAKPKRNQSETEAKPKVKEKVKEKVKVSANADIAPASARESETANAIYRAYPARGRKFFADTLKAIMTEARSYAEAHDVSVADALAYMLTQTQLFASIAGRSRYVSRSDQFFAQGDWQGDAEQWRAQFDDGDDDGEDTPVDREDQARKWHEQWERDRAAAFGDTSSELPPETVAMFARLQAEQAGEDAGAAKAK